ncbi:hypothetical protein HZ326_15934 [Fusarium oxysporum f. sp. albedinis]|nr:hypothetical protein HZ326_15934 [Fusarium oxysporum f. sp. albedinis]
MAQSPTIAPNVCKCRDWGALRFTQHGWRNAPASALSDLLEEKDHHSDVRKLTMLRSTTENQMGPIIDTKRCMSKGPHEQWGNPHKLDVSILIGRNLNAFCFGRNPIERIDIVAFLRQDKKQVPFIFSMDSHVISNRDYCEASHICTGTHSNKIRYLSLASLYVTPLRMICMVIHNAKIHKAARTEKGHLIRSTLRPPSNMRQSGTSNATLQLATSARLRWLRKWRTPITIHEVTRRASTAAWSAARHQAPVWSVLTLMPPIRQSHAFRTGQMAPE